MLQKACREARCNVQLNPWTTSNTSKQNIVEKLIQDFATENILIPDIPDLLDQLNNFEAEYSAKSKSIIYSGKMNGKDDRVMSLCICNYNRANAPTGSYHVSVARRIR